MRNEMTAIATTVSANEVAAVFSLGHPISELASVARGAMGVVFRLDTDRGAFAIKKLFHGPTGNEEANAALQLAALGAGVSLPRPLLTNDNTVVTQFGDGCWWRAYEWVKGDHCDEQPSPVSVGASLAEQLGRLHTLGYDAGSNFDAWYWEPVGADRINAAIDEAIARGWPLEGRRAQLIATDALVAAADGDGPLIGCHHDAGRGNVLVRHGECTLLDWDNAGPGRGTWEFAGTLVSWGSDEALLPALSVVDAMVRAYRETGAVFAPTDLSVFATGCSAWLHYVVMCCEHLADPTLTADDLEFEGGALEHLVNTDQSILRLERFLEAIPA